MKILENIKKFAEQGRIAVICDGEQLSYSELDRFSDAFASYIINEFGENNSSVVIYGNKDNLILVSMIAALKSGRAYIPLDITVPIERVEQILDDVKPVIFINFTEEDVKYNNSLNKEMLISIINELEKHSCSSQKWVKNDENCYILFTSGSTGKPKGVQISKNNLDSFNDWFTEYLNMDESEEVIMNQVSYSFDVSVIPIYIGLINGKTLFTLSKKTLEDYKALFEALKISKIKYWVSTPALAELCIKDNSFNESLLQELELFVFAGEVLSKKLVSELLDRFTETRIINGYGPTEATVLISAIDVTKEMLEDQRSIPIGYPMTGANLKIVDKDNKEVANGEKGELLVTGKSVSKGYFNNEKITNEVFFNEETEGNVVRGYRTGDLAYYEDNIIYYCGRKDFQIKLNGFRIELEDIESNLRRVQNINNAVVFPSYKGDKISHLVAFVTLENDNGLSNLKNSILIKDELKRYIPSYMIPRNIKIIKEFPINTNGKIDRKKLMEEI